MPLLSRVDHTLSDGKPFRHPSPKRACRYARLRLSRKVELEDIGEFARFEMF
jgi:hypothetical protein